MLPTKKQWKAWSLPSKLTAIGTCAGILGLVLAGIGLVPWLLGTEPQTGRPDTTSAAHSPAGLQIRVGSLLRHRFDFTIGSTDQKPFVVKNLYLRLRGYAECPLRNEYSILGAAAFSTSYSVELSPEYARYDLPSLASPGDSGVWTYPGSADHFGVEVFYPDYVLFVVSIEAEGDFLAPGKSFHVSSEEIDFIDVARGNAGGCLDLSSWYDPKMLRLPRAQMYLENVSVLTRQLFTVDVNQSSSFLFKVPRDHLARVMPELETVNKSRAGNRVFARNLDEVRKVLFGNRPRR